MKFLRKTLFGEYGKYSTVDEYKSFFTTNLLSIGAILIYSVFAFYYTVVFFYWQLLLLNFIGIASCVVAKVLNARKFKQLPTITMAVSLNIVIIFKTLIVGWSSGYALFVLAAIFPHFLYTDLKKSMKAIIIALTLINVNANLYVCFTGIAPMRDIFPMATEVGQRLDFALLVVNMITIMLILEVAVATLVIKHAEKNYANHIEKAHHFSILDPLTEVYNRRFLSTKHINADCDTIVVFLDIDLFKDINDNYGHEVGDMVLQHFSSAIKAVVKPKDVIVRWGGEEFVMFVKCSDIHAVSQMLLAIRAELLKSPFISVRGVSLPYTFSGGFYKMRDGERLEDAVQKADLLMYKAKQAGRNKCFTLDDDRNYIFF